MNNKTASIPQKRKASVVGRQVRFLDRDPVPPSLCGKEGRLERMVGREAVIWVDGIRRRVPKNWLVIQGSTSPPVGSDAEGDDDPITEQAWYSLLDVCLELNLSPEEAQQVIAEAVGVPPDELDPSRLTWRQYLQAIEQLEQLERLEPTT